MCLRVSPSASARFWKCASVLWTATSGRWKRSAKCTASRAIASARSKPRPCASWPIRHACAIGRACFGRRRAGETVGERYRGGVPDVIAVGGQIIPVSILRVLTLIFGRDSRDRTEAARKGDVHVVEEDIIHAVGHPVGVGAQNRAA